MLIDQLKPNIIVRGPIFPEPVQVIVAIPMGSSVKLVGKGLNTNQVHEMILNTEQLAQLNPPPKKNPSTAIRCVFDSVSRLIGSDSLMSTTPISPCR